MVSAGCRRRRRQCLTSLCLYTGSTWHGQVIISVMSHGLQPVNLTCGTGAYTHVILLHFHISSLPPTRYHEIILLVNLKQKTDQISREM